MNAGNYQWHHIRNLIFDHYTCTLFNQIDVYAHAVFHLQGTLLKMILIIRKFQKSSFQIYLALLALFGDFTAVTTTTQGGSPIPPNLPSTAYDLIMLKVDDILPPPLTPLVLPYPVPEPVCKKQTPALFTMAQSFPQPQSVDTINYARVNPLPSPATSSSSSGKLHLCIESDTSSPLVTVGPPSSSQELLLQRDQLVRQPPPTFATTTNTLTSTSQLPLQPMNISSWSDEVSIAEQSGRSTP